MKKIIKGLALFSVIAICGIWLNVPALAASENAIVDDNGRTLWVIDLATGESRLLRVAGGGELLVSGTLSIDASIPLTMSLTGQPPYTIYLSGSDVVLTQTRQGVHQLDPLPAGTATIGAVKNAGSNYTILSGYEDGADLSSLTQVIAGVASNQLSIRTVFISASSACNCQIQDDSGTPLVLIPSSYFAADGGMFLGPFEPEAIQAASGKDVEIQCSNANPTSVLITVYQIPD